MIPDSIPELIQALLFYSGCLVWFSFVVVISLIGYSCTRDFISEFKKSIKKKKNGNSRR